MQLMTHKIFVPISNSSYLCKLFIRVKRLISMQGFIFPPEFNVTHIIHKENSGEIGPTLN